MGQKVVSGALGALWCMVHSAARGGMVGDVHGALWCTLVHQSATRMLYQYKSLDQSLDFHGVSKCKV